MTLIEVSKYLVEYAIIVGAIGWVSKRTFAHWLDKNVTKYQSDLQNAHDLEMVRLRNDLSVRSLEHEIRFRSIHEKQAEILAETYSLLYQLQETVVSYVAGGPPPLEVGDSMIDSHRFGGFVANGSAQFVFGAASYSIYRTRLAALT